MVLNELKKVKSLCDYYDKLRDDFGSAAESLKNDILNSVRELKSNISYRIKEKNSLYEKLIRKNCVTQIKSLETIEFEYFIYNNEFTDDLIGLIIITNLSIYDEEVYKILLKNKDLLKSKKINLYIDSESKKSIMHNKFEFYKFKGDYFHNQKTFRFELQIKSHIFYAWSNIEHNLFYKDYSFYHEKENNRLIVEDTGKILLKMEDLLLIALNTKKNHTRIYYLNKTLSEIHSKFNVENDLGTKLETGFINDILKHILIDKYDNINIDSIKLKYEFMNKNIELKDNLVRNYLTIRECNYKLGYLEYIYFNILDHYDSKAILENPYHKFMEEIIEYFESIANNGKRIINVKEYMIGFFYRETLSYVIDILDLKKFKVLYFFIFKLNEGTSDLFDNDEFGEENLFEMYCIIQELCYGDFNNINKELLSKYINVLQNIYSNKINYSIEFDKDVDEIIAKNLNNLNSLIGGIRDEKYTNQI